MLIDILKIVAGFVLLIGGGQFLVKGAVEITKYFNISKLVVGMTVVAFGTSAPELLVSVQAAFKNSADIALGNVIGSNIANVALVLGISIAVLPIFVKKETIKFDWPIMMGLFAMLWLFMWDNVLTRIEGAILFASLIAFVWWEIRYSLKNHVTDEKDEEEKKFSIPIAVLIIIAASAALAYGSDILVEGTKNLALAIGISERVISISVIALGTSLPELAASLTAAIKKESDISVGNIIGSNIFNIASILGITSLLHPIKFNFADFQNDLIWMTAIGLVLFLSFLPLKKRFVNRYKGIIFVAIYVLYMILLFQK